MTKAIVLLCDMFMQIVPIYGKCAIVRDSTFIWCQFVLGFILRYEEPRSSLRCSDFTFIDGYVFSSIIAKLRFVQ